MVYPQMFNVISRILIYRQKLDRQHRRNKIGLRRGHCLVDVQHREQRTTERPVADADDVELRLDVVDVAGTHTDEQ